MGNDLSTKLCRAGQKAGQHSICEVSIKNCLLVYILFCCSFERILFVYTNTVPLSLSFCVFHSVRVILPYRTICKVKFMLSPYRTPSTVHVLKFYACLASFNPHHTQEAGTSNNPKLQREKCIMGLGYHHPFSNDRAGVLNIQSLCYTNTYVTDTILGSRTR